MNKFITPKSKVKGLYHGVSFTGVVTDSTCWLPSTYIHKVTLDSPIVIHGLKKDKLIIDSRLSANSLEVIKPTLLSKLKNIIKNLSSK